MAYKKTFSINVLFFDTLYMEVLNRRY